MGKRKVKKIDYSKLATGGFETANDVTDIPVEIKYKAFSETSKQKYKRNKTKAVNAAKDRGLGNKDENCLFSNVGHNADIDLPNSTETMSNSILDCRLEETTMADADDGFIPDYEEEVDIIEGESVVNESTIVHVGGMVASSDDHGTDEIEFKKGKRTTLM